MIFDEFQRFFDDLVSGAEPVEEQAEQEHRKHADEVLRAILKPDADIRNAAEPPAVLLLSATPYRLYARRREGGQHHDEFFRLLRFLFADEHEVQCAALREDFRAYRLALEGDPVGSRRASEIKQRIEARLSRVMVRTERGHLVPREPAKRALRQIAIEVRDLHVFRHLCDSVRVQDRSTTEPYWSSIPYPLQMMGDDYVTSRHATRIRRSKRARLARLARKRIADYSHTSWAHPRLRALLAHLPEALLSLPWLPPTRPWWCLGPPFDAVPHATKALVFSRFRAVPRALATLLSYEAERRAFDVTAAQERYAYFPERSPEGGKRLRPRPAEAFTFKGPEQSGAGPHNRDLLAMFLPFRALAKHGDPLALTVRTPDPMTRRQTRNAVRGRLIEVLGAPAPHRGRRNVLAWAITLERATSGWDAFAGGVEDAVGGLGIDGLGEAVRAALKCNEPAGAPTEAELDELAEFALTAPGIVLGRATRRVFGVSSDERARAKRLAHTALGSLRKYLDDAEWHRILKSPNGHRAAVQEAVWSGNLEAVLDEYLVLLQGLGTRAPDESSEKTALDELDEVLSIKAVNLQVHEIGRDREPMRLRCHAALSFGLRERADEERDTLRAELVRKAFNAPFRPMVLATTSIGQEGLDFHRYCRHVIHWDLPRNPVDLEQREGRIERHGGLAVRHALAERVEVRPHPRSPWHTLSEKLFGEEQAGGLVPWWHVDGIELLRTALAPHLSEQRDRLEALEDDLALYRYALGQPDQEALVRALARRRDHGDEVAQAELERWLQDATLDLCPLPRDQRI